MKGIARTILAAMMLGALSPALAEEHVVSQEGMEFSPQELEIQVGDTVVFRNDDTVSHNVYSLSEAKSFDLGSYAQGEARNVTFDQPGTVEVGCAVHAKMSMTIEVKP